MQESEGVLCMRVSFRIALAGQVIGVSALYEQTRTFCKNYLTDAPASFEVAVTPADIAFEREKNDREAAVEGHAPGNFSDEYLETLALYRKIVERLLEWDTLLFHGSCISVDSKAYLFTAKSGTGKSTHTQLWKKWFGERAVFINDDKAFIYKDSKSPYQVVLANIQRLLDAGVAVLIRLNMDEHNADNLMELADELHEQFGENKKLTVYSHVLYEFLGCKEGIPADSRNGIWYMPLKGSILKDWS